MIGRVLLIANPASRRGENLVARATRAFERARVLCDVVMTERIGHASEIATERAAAYDAVFTLGGDGTAMEVGTALAGTPTPLGVLPGGTGNLLARAMRIPFRLERTIPRLLDGEQIAIDLGRFADGRRFAIAAGVGIDASMVQNTPTTLKRRFGVLAYAYIGSRAAISAVRRRDFIKARITVDGVVTECDAVAIMIANFGAVLSDRITLGEHIHADDGVLDVCIFTPTGVIDACRIMWRMVRRDFSPTPAMRYCTGREIHISCDPPRIFQADGELVGLTPFTVTVDPLALRLLIPRRRQRRLP